MVLATTAVTVPLALIALVARRRGSGLEETAWRLVAVAMIVTPIALLLPKVDIGIRIPLLTAEEVVAATETPRLQFESGPPVLYFAVATVLVLRLLVAWAGAARATHATVRVPVTVGLLRPKVLLPVAARSWSREKLAAVLAHERAHVTRRDPLWRFIGHLGAAICWFHPLAWVAARSIDRLAEEAADREGVVAAGDRHTYAGLLIEIAGTMTRSPRILASAMHGRAGVARRIDAILDARERPRTSSLAAITMSLFFAFSLFASTLTKVEAPPGIAQERWSDEDLLRARDELRTLTREKLRSFFRSFRG